MALITGYFRESYYQIEFPSDIKNSRKFLFITCDLGEYSGIQSAIQSAYNNPDIHILCMIDYPPPKCLPRNLEIIRCSRLVGDKRFLGKLFKVKPEIFLSDYDMLVWFDANVILKSGSLEKMSQLDGSDLYLFKHNKRETIVDEANTIIKWGKDSSDIVNNFLMKVDGNKNEYPLYQGRFFIRKNSARVADFNSCWFEAIKNYSIRDQISLPVCAKKRECLVEAYNAKDILDHITIEPHLKFDVSHYDSTFHGRIKAFISKLLYFILVIKRR